GDCGGGASAASASTGRSVPSPPGGGAASTASGRVDSSRRTSVIADPRVGHGEENVGDEIAEDEHDRRHQDRPHDEVLVLREDRVERDAAESRPRKDDLHDE